MDGRERSPEMRALGMASAIAEEVQDFALFYKRFTEHRATPEDLAKQQRVLVQAMNGVARLVDWLSALEEGAPLSGIRLEINNRTIRNIGKTQELRGESFAEMVIGGGIVRDRNALAHALLGLWKAMDGWRKQFDALAVFADDALDTLGLTPADFAGLRGEEARRVAKKAFDRLAMACHPDKFPNNPEKAAEFLRLREAFDKVIAAKASF